MSRVGMAALALLLAATAGDAGAQECPPTAVDFSAHLDFAPPLRRGAPGSAAETAAATPLATTSRSVAASFQISANGPTFNRGSIDTETVMRLVAERLDRVGRELPPRSAAVAPASPSARASGSPSPTT